MAESPIPNRSDWRVARLGEITLKIGSGATPTGGKESYLARREHFALIRSQNVFDRQFNQDGLAFISADQAERLKGAEVHDGDLLLNITGDGATFSRVCAAPGNVLPACVNQHVAIIRVDPLKADARYVLSYLTHPLVKSYIESFNAGGSRRAITKGHIESFRLPLPPLEEQQIVGRILGDLDDKIELNRRMAETLEAMARALFRSWFVDFDPVHARAEGRPTGLPDDLAALFPDSFGGDGLPDGWATVANDVGQVVRVAVEPREIDPGTPYVGLEHLERGSLVIRQHGCAADVDSLKNVFKAGDLLFGKLRPYFEKVAIAPFDGVCSSDILVFRPIEGVPSVFLYLWFSHSSFIAAASNASSGTRMPRADWAYMRRLPTALPAPDLRNAFDQALVPLLNRMLSSAIQSRTLAALRDTLLPKLISGELRIANAEQRVAAA